MLTNNPLILYDLKKPDQYSMIAGVEQSGALFPQAQTWDCLKNWIVTTDATGIVTVQMDFIVDPGLQFLLLGAHRHDASGARFAGGSVQLQYWDGAAWSDCLAATAIVAATNEPSLQELAAHTVVLNAGYYSYRLTLSALAANTDIAVPEIFTGPGMTMPMVDLPFDPKLEEFGGPTNTSSTGRIYGSVLYKRYLAKPSWTDRIDAAQALLIDDFRENHIENRTPFWWFWAPSSYPRDGYMMRHNSPNAPMPISAGPYRSFSLNMVEAV